MRTSRKAAMETLKSQNAQMAKAFETEGTCRVTPTPDSPDGKLRQAGRGTGHKDGGQGNQGTSLREGHGDPAGQGTLQPVGPVKGDTE